MMSTILAALAAKRPVFHSEADFQHALAWELHLLDPRASIRLEQRKTLNGEAAYIDLTGTVQGQPLAIELKYKTARSTCVIDGETFDLTGHGAQDIGACLFWKDVERLEQLKRAANSPMCAYAIFLTNDGSYWRSSGRTGTNADAFRLSDGRTAGRSMSWGERTSERTRRVHDKTIELTTEYALRWRDYSEVNGVKFRYLLLEIP